ncbi:MAG: hypothetical protein FJ147_00130 [Deltaproteobacteria bacterium]|nr:hypothetical protein [Deltaproteobacteria bacterium]
MNHASHPAQNHTSTVPSKAPYVYIAALTFSLIASFWSPLELGFLLVAIVTSGICFCLMGSSARWMQYTFVRFLVFWGRSAVPARHAYTFFYPSSEPQSFLIALQYMAAWVVVFAGLQWLVQVALNELQVEEEA